MRERFEEIELSDGPADAAPVEFMRDCPACGHANPMNHVTCEACGVVVSKARPERKLQTRNMGDARVVPPREPSRLGGVIASVLVLGAIAFAVWFFVFRASYQVVGPPIGQGERTVILLHSFGAPGDALVSRANQLSAKLPQISWVLPPGPHSARTGRAWVVGPGDSQARASVKESRAAIADLIREVQGKGVDSSQIYLGGYSQGAQLALDFALAPDTPAVQGLILISGGPPTWPGAHTLTESELAEGTVVFLAHGEKDATVGIEQAARLRARMFEAGIAVEFHTAPGGHAVDDGTVDALVDWLAR